MEICKSPDKFEAYAGTFNDDVIDAPSRKAVADILLAACAEGCEVLLAVENKNFPEMKNQCESLCSDVSTTEATKFARCRNDIRTFINDIFCKLYDLSEWDKHIACTLIWTYAINTLSVNNAERPPSFAEEDELNEWIVSKMTHVNNCIQVSSHVC